jgi:hypothetical protein
MSNKTQKDMAHALRAPYLFGFEAINYGNAKVTAIRKPVMRSP